MKLVEHPINVLLLGKGGKGENTGCTGPQQLRTWIAQGRVEPATQVFVRSTAQWMTADTYLSWCDKKSDTEQLYDMDATLTNLLSVAEELKLASGGRCNAAGNGSRPWETWSANRDSEHDDDDDSDTIRHTGAVSSAN